jgi:hypothetical protein
MKIETKYDIGQEVWFMWNNKATHRKIVGVIVGKDNEQQSEEYDIAGLEDDDMTLCDVTFKCEDIFQTKEELLKSL